jgi:hypothetical protein
VVLRALPRRLRPAAAAACLSLLPLSPSGFAATRGQAPAAPPSPGTVTIEHDAPGCLPAGKPARLAACFRPQGALARARVYFRAGGTTSWYYVEMSGPPPCLQATLPRPKKSVKRVEYYVDAMDRSFAETRTPDRALPVSQDGQCPAGPLAPIGTGTPVIGSATGAAPVGFAAGGSVSPLLLVGGAAVVGGGVAVAVAAGGGGGESPTTTTLPPVTTSTTTTTLPPPSTTTTTTNTTTTTSSTSSTTTTSSTSSTSTTTSTTTTLTPCETQPPTLTITAPTNDLLSGSQVTISADASDAGGSGVKQVRFSWQYCPSGVCGGQNALPADTSAPYSAVWVFPGCGSFPEDRYRILASAEDNCGNVSTDSVKDVRLIGRGCDVRPMAAGPSGNARASAASWVSELSVQGGRGQVVVDGTDAVFPAGGVETFTAAAGPGTHRFEATLVASAGRPGSWRFDLTALRAVPGSLKVVAGEAAVAGSAAVVFRLGGKPGERVVFSVEVGGGE